MIKKAFFFYPPGPQYQRGEDRSQGNIDTSTATAMRSPNDMGYVSSQLKKKDVEIFFKDYSSENLSYDDLLNDFKAFQPDIVLSSTTTSTINDDLKILNNLKELMPNAIYILKAALFYNAPLDLLKSMDLSSVDFLVGGEIEFAVEPIVEKINNKSNYYNDVPGIFFKENDKWIITEFNNWSKEIDELPVPDRSIINNGLYVRPDTGEPQATVATSRGCPAACIYCLTPTISGKKVRFRSPQSVLDELINCYDKFNIKNFFFKSDTFTIDKKWVKEVCDLIKKSKLHKKIEWVANSRVKPLEQETLNIMKEAGCWLVAFGFESGSDETLKKIKKGANVENNLIAAEYTKNAGLKLYGFYLIGLPWENLTHLNMTKKLIFDTKPDFLELHIAVPYYGTELYEMAKKEGLIKAPVLGQNYFEEATTGTHHLTSKELISFRRKVIAQYHLRPQYLYQKLKETNFNYTKFKNYSKYGLRLISNLVK
jgi:anaerobic magnesium-protoporphyrin IX monomethyl ester cyclase